MRYGDGVLAQPILLTEVQAIEHLVPTITISGDGYADIIPETNEVVLDGVAIVPGSAYKLDFQHCPI